MPRLDYYQILGVSTDAGLDALKRAYRLRARQWHPDRNPGDLLAAERFKSIQEAYSVLSDPRRRRAYDAALGGRTQVQHLAHSASEAMLDEELRDEAEHGEVHVDVDLAFEQALKGGHTYVANGDGELVRVTIPRGCRDGTTTRLRGRGSQTNGRRGSDLYIHFHVAPHPRFRREGNHLHVIEAVSVIEAVLGTTRSICNPYGQKVRVRIPPGTQPGERLRLRGLGVQTAKGKGDLFVEIDVRIPKELTDEQRAKLREAARNMGLL